MVLDGVHDLEEGWSLSAECLTSLKHGSLNVGGVTCTACRCWSRSGGWLGLTCWLLTHEFTLGSWAECWLLALPVTLGLLTHGGAHCVGCGTCSTALGWSTDSLTLGAVLRLTHILGATNITLWLVTVNLACGTWSLLTVHLTLRALTHRVALGRAGGVITLPTALRMALGGSGLGSNGCGLGLQLHVQLHGGGGDGAGQEENQQSDGKDTHDEASVMNRYHRRVCSVSSR